MKIYKLKVLILMAMVMISSQSCDFGDTNIDPESLTDSKVSLNLLLPSAIAHTGFNGGSGGARLTGIIMQYFEGLDAQQIDFSNYNITDNALNNLWRTGLYAGSMKDLNLIIKKSDELKAPHYKGIAQILMATQLAQVTSLFGDAPYSDAFKGDKQLNPKYDTQEELFKTIFKLLDGGIAELAKPGGNIVPKGDDLIFGGKAEKWISTGHALKARYFIMQSKKGSSNFTNALTSLSKAFKANADNAIVTFEDTQNGSNPFAQFDRDRPGTLGLAPSFLARLENDPRKDLISAGGKSFVGENSYWTKKSGPVALITYAECLFIKAEAQKATGVSDAAVLVTLKDAIKASMSQMGVASADITSYISKISDSSIKSIINEKYVGIYPSSVSWDDYRRTGFPNITPSKKNSDGLNPGGKIPRRFIYPLSEKNFNKKSLSVAIQRQGGDLMNVVLWVFK